MKNLLILFFLVAHVAAGQQSKTRLIVRGDDMGYAHSGNEALIKCSKEGIQTSIEVIVPSPWFPEAVRMLKQNPTIDVGIHLALTSEWDNVKWRPLTDCSSLRDSNGYFLPMVYFNKHYPAQSILTRKWNIADVEKEFRAQIILAKKMLPQVSHISSHMNCTNITPEVTALTKRLAKEYNLDIDPADYNVSYTGYEGPSKTSEEKINSFIAMLKNLEKGRTYMFVDHPGLDNAELRAISHVGYEHVAIDRQGVTDLFTSEKVKAAIKERDIQLISYKDLTAR
jgi:chitin disaccharide deacetylase